MKPPIGRGEAAEVDLGEQLRAVIIKIVRAEIASDRAPQQLAAEQDGMLTVEQAAKRLRMSVSYVRGAIRDGRLPAVRMGRAVRLRASDVDAAPVSRPNEIRLDPAERAARILGVPRR